MNKTGGETTLPKIQRISFKLLAVAVTALMLRSAPLQAAMININFDVDPAGNPINAPGLFVNAQPLTNLYSSLGVTFAGPTSLNDGAIVNQLGNVGVNALNGTNFLGFNTNGPNGTTMLNGGQPIGPETLLFAFPVVSVSIFGGDHQGDTTFQMQAFNSQSQLVATDTVSVDGGIYAHLNVASSDIRSVTLNATRSFTGAWVFDNLSFNTVPEPPSLTLLAIGALGLAARRWQRQRLSAFSHRR